MLERLPSNSPYDFYNDQIRKHGRLTFLIINFKEMYIRTLDKVYVVYELLCMQTNEIMHLTLREKNVWKKIS